MTGAHDAPTLIRRLLPFTTVALIAAALYVGWIFYSRWQETRAAEERAAAKRAAENRYIVEAYGNGRVKILNFSFDPGVIRRGQQSELCYGVSNAKTVTIEPPVKEDLYPAMNRCFKISPLRTTKYTLTAVDSQGHSESVSLQLHVQ